MKETLIGFQVAKLAKEKGFDLKCSSHWSTYDNDGLLNNFLRIEEGARDYNKHEFAYISNKKEELFSAPTQSLLQKWLREKHNIHIRPDLPWVESGWLVKGYSLIDGSELFSINKYKQLNSFEDALEEGLLEALKLIK